jgi:protein TonB
VTDFRLQRSEVQAPLAAPTYLTHVTAPSFRRRRFFTIAVALHVIAVVAFLVVLHVKYPVVPPQEPTLSLVVTDQPFTGTGPQVLSPEPSQPMRRPVHAAPARPVITPPMKAAPPAADAQATSPDIAQTAKLAALPLPAPEAPPPPQPAPRPASSAPAAQTHLGDDQPAGSGLVIDSQIIPAVPDAAVNQPPEYPREALVHGEQGRVLLSIHVLPSGKPSVIRVANSSGYAVLDQAAAQAVMHWQFLPAQRAGKAVASVLPFWISFQLN